MCRSIKTLRPPMTTDATSEDTRAAALQYVRKVTGFRDPSKANHDAFWSAVDEVARATQQVLDDLVIRSSQTRIERSVG
ncbi:MAG TPA: DUF2277 domain-containing protein [Acidimicrobiia bacterium]|nr:DUF2277 domain-containing protein [Acidimicrobiia bacterium]